MQTRLFRRSGVAVLLAVGATLPVACHDGASGLPAPDLIVSLSAASVTVVQGASENVVLNVTRINFAGALALALDGAPAGTTVTFEPPSLPSTTAMGSFVLAVDASVTPGTYTLTLRVSGQGVDEHAAVLTLTVVAGPSFALSVAPPVLAVARNATVSATVTVTRTGGFTGPVSLTVVGAPAGVTAVVTPAVVTNATASLDIAAGDVVPGSHMLRVEGTANGLAVQTATFQLDILAPPDFSLSVAPSHLTVSQFGAASATVTIGRTGSFTGAVDLTVSGAPAGVVAVVSPTSVTGTTATLDVTAAAAAPGPYTLLVEGSAAGLPTRSVEVSLQIVAGNAQSVTVQFCGSDIPLWVAARTEGGNWEQVTGTADHRFGFNMGPRGAVAAVMPFDEGGYGLTVIHATVSEFAALGAATVADCLRPTSGSKRLHGSLEGLGQEDVGMVALGDALTAVPGGLTPSFTLENAPDGAADLVAVRMAGPTSHLSTTRIIFRRNVNYPDGTTVMPFDFASNEARTVDFDVNWIANVGTDVVTAVSTFHTARGTSVPLSIRVDRTGQGFWNSALNWDDVQPGDMHELLATAQPDGGSDYLRGVACYAQYGIVWQNFALGPMLSTPTITNVASAGYRRLRVELPYQAAYSGAFAAVFQQGTGSAFRGVELFATRGYLADPTAPWELTIPDLSAAGFDPAWGLASGAFTWTVAASNSSRYLVGGVLPQAQCDVTFAMRGDLNWASGLSVSPRVSLGPRLNQAARAPVRRWPQ